MKNYILIVFFFFILFSCKRKDFEGPTIKSGTIEIVSIPATDQNVIDTQDAAIYLPPDYDPDFSPGYPVIYLLHGFGGDPYFWTELIAVQEIADYLISAGEISPCIIVMPMGKNFFGGSWYTNSRDGNIPVFGEWETYIVNDVVSYVDANYNTIPEKSKRAITGLSMGGYGAIKLAALHPDVFGSAASHSGVLAFDLFLVDANNNNIADLIEVVLAENGGSIDRSDFLTLGPQKVYTLFMVSMAAAFSPKIGPLASFDTTRNEWNLVQIPGGIWLGIKLPFLNSGDTIKNVWDLWKNNDPSKIFVDSASKIIANGLRVYIDCGSQDDYKLNFHAEYFSQILQQLGINYEKEIYSGETEGIMYPPDEFPALHTNYLYERLKKSFIFHDKFFKGD